MCGIYAGALQRLFVAGHARHRRVVERSRNTAWRRVVWRRNVGQNALRPRRTGCVHDTRDGARRADKPDAHDDLKPIRSILEAARCRPAQIDGSGSAKRFAQRKPAEMVLTPKVVNEGQIEIDSNSALNRVCRQLYGSPEQYSVIDNAYVPNFNHEQNIIARDGVVKCVNKLSIPSEKKRAQLEIPVLDGIVLATR
jgi:hypothetical protein